MAFFRVRLWHFTLLVCGIFPPVFVCGILPCCDSTMYPARLWHCTLLQLCHFTPHLTFISLPVCSSILPSYVSLFLLGCVAHYLCLAVVFTISAILLSLFLLCCSHCVFLSRTRSRLGTARNLPQVLNPLSDISDFMEAQGVVSGSNPPKPLTYAAAITVRLSDWCVHLHAPITFAAVSITHCLMRSLPRSDPLSLSLSD